MAFSNMLRHSFDGYMLASFFQSIVFVVFFVFFGDLNFIRFVFIEWRDMLLFTVSVVVDIAFFTLSTFLIPESMSDTGEIQTLVTTPLAVLVFVVVVHFKFKKY